MNTLDIAHPDARPAADFDRVERGVLSFLAAANVFDMSGGFGLKYASYGACAIFLVARHRQIGVPRNSFLVCVVLFLAWPLFSALQGVMQGADTVRAIQRITAFVPALLVMPILASSRNPKFLVDAVMTSLLALSIVITIMFGVLMIAPDAGYSTLMLDVLTDRDQGKFGARMVGDITIPNVYFKATLFLVPASVWYLYRRRFAYSGLCLLGLALAFSRSGVLLAGIVMGVYCLLLAPMRVRIVFSLLVAGAVYFVWTHAELLQLSGIIDMYVDVLTGQGQSASERSGHFKSIIELLAQDSSVLWFGQGAGMMFFSSGVNAFVSAVELDHLDAIRSFGLLWFIGFTLIVFHAAGIGRRLESTESRGLRVAVMAGFVAAGTNPVLINPLFCILVAATYYFQHSAGPSHGNP